MLRIKEIVNSIFASKTYILYEEGENEAWLVDVGDIEPIMVFCKEKGLFIDGVFLTHAHFDHFYGLPALLRVFPTCKVFTNEYGKRALASEKLNLSRYHETPISYKGNNVVVVQEGDEVPVSSKINASQMRIYETPGHNPSCVTMIIGNWIFTGDSYIPGVGTNTVLPYANKEQSKRSLERIMKLVEGKTILSGHQV